MLGCLLGGISGYYGGVPDLIIQRIIEFLISIPVIPFRMGLAAALPHDWPSLRIYFAITIILGICRHFLPSFMSYLIVSLTLAVPNMILGETALSFLGLGLQPPVVSWGVLLQDAQNLQSLANHSWLLIPGIFVVASVLAFNFVGDGLRDAADPSLTATGLHLSVIWRTTNGNDDLWTLAGPKTRRSLLRNNQNHAIVCQRR